MYIYLSYSFSCFRWRFASTRRDVTEPGASRGWTGFSLGGAAAFFGVALICSVVDLVTFAFPFCLLGTGGRLIVLPWLRVCSRLARIWLNGATLRLSLLPPVATAAALFGRSFASSHA